MKTTPFLRMILALALLWWWPANRAQAQDEAIVPSIFEGTWTWDFTMPDSSKISPTLRIHTQEDGSLLLTSRFRPGSSVEATNVSINGKTLSFAIVREREGRLATTRYSGTLEGDTLRGIIVANGSGTNVESPWLARRNIHVEGSWKWTLRPPNRPGSHRDTTPSDESEPSGIELRLTLKRDAEKLSGKLQIGPTSELEIKHGRFRDGIVTFQTVRERNGAPSTNNYVGRFQTERIQGQVLTYVGTRVRTNTWRAMRAE